MKPMRSRIVRELKRSSGINVDLGTPLHDIMQ